MFSFLRFNLIRGNGDRKCFQMMRDDSQIDFALMESVTWRIERGDLWI